MPQSKSSGFTLIEVALAVVLGVILVAGASALYGQARQSAANAKMSERLMALSSRVEEFSSSHGRYPIATDPSNRELPDLWKARRPDDYLSSPFGGYLGAGLQGTANGVDEGAQPVPSGAQWGWTNTYANAGGLDRSGGMQYFVVSDAANNPIQATASFYDKTLSAFTTYRGYCVQGVGARNEDGWIVMGPHP